MPKKKPNDAAAILKSILSEKHVNDLGLECGQSERLREVTPFRLAIALLTAMSGGRMTSLADILREFNFQNETSVAYKAFYNRLARPEFAVFMRQLCAEMMVALSMRILEPKPGSSLSKFLDILIQDGTSFAVKEGVPLSFGGGIAPAGPPVVRLHTLFSAFKNAVESAVLTGNRIAEPTQMPDACELKDILYMGDRIYAARDRFRELDQEDASFIVRLSRSYDPMVLAEFRHGKAIELPRRMRLREFLAQTRSRNWDLLVSWKRPNAPSLFRIVVFPSKEKGGTRLCTNLNAQEFSRDEVGKLYRFRWQIELLFKEWKSFTNLHRFNTKNEHIIEGLIWASLAAAIVARFVAHAAQPQAEEPISTMKAARSTSSWLREILNCLLRQPLKLVKVWRQAVNFLSKCARRARPKRDETEGRLCCGLQVVEAAK